MSLLELLVAFSILAMSLGALYKAMGTNARSVAAAELYQRAIVIGESLLASRDVVPADGLSESGRSGIYDWHVSSVPFATEAAQRNPSSPPLHELSIEIAWREQDARRSVQLHTLRPQRLNLPGAGVR